MIDRLSEITRTVRKDFGYNDRQIADLLHDFMHNEPLDQFGSFKTKFTKFLREHHEAEVKRRDTTVLSLILEHPSKDVFRAIIFETDYAGVTTVKDIAEAAQLYVLRDWFNTHHGKIKCVYANGGVIEVSDPFLTATCLIQKTTS